MRSRKDRWTVTEESREHKKYDTGIVAVSDNICDGISSRLNLLLPIKKGRGHSVVIVVSSRR
jgi:hypothetical protein